MDAPVDAPVDAPADAPVDAAVEATVDAAVDAPMLALRKEKKGGWVMECNSLISALSVPDARADSDADGYDGSLGHCLQVSQNPDRREKPPIPEKARRNHA